MQYKSFTDPEYRVVVGVPLLLDYGLWRFQRTGVLGWTIRNDISGINMFLQYYGMGIQLGKGYSDPLQKLYRGCNRLRVLHGIDTKCFYRRALTNKILEAMLAYMDPTYADEQLVRVLLLFAKHTALRCHNYIYTDGRGLVRIKHVKFGPAGNKKKYFIVTVPLTKTQQIDAPIKETRTVKCRCNIGLCPVHELLEYLQGRLDGTHENEALFLLPNGFPVTYRKLRKILVLLCELVNLDWHYYTPHALRIGEATDRNIGGESLERTMKYIGWRSKRSAMIYIRPDNPDFVKFE